MKSLFRRGTAVLLALLFFLSSSMMASALQVSGIDVSYWQGNNIDWAKVKADGYSFAILRISYTGKNGPDTTFETNYKNAKAAGVAVGGYMYSYAITVQQAIQDANKVIGWLEGKQMEYPIYYDMEDAKLLNNGLTTAQRTEIALAFVRTLQEHGYYAGVYANLDWFTNYLNLNDIQAVCDTWIAHYRAGMDYSARHGMWQKSAEGSVNGISGNVDLDECYVDYPTIIKQGGYNGFPKPEPSIIYLEPSGLAGDVNADGARDLSDVVALAQYVAGWSGLSVVQQELNADRDDDGIANLLDVTYLAQWVAGWYPDE